MKNIAYLFLLLFASCQCTKTTTQVPEGTTPGGYVTDKPEDIAKVRLHVSKDFKDGIYNVPLQVRGGKGGGKGDRVAPNMSISFPKPGDTVKGTTKITFSYSDNVGVTQVDLTINGSRIPISLGSQFYSWAPTVVGTYAIQGYAKDAAGNTGITPQIVVTYKATVVVEPPSPVLPVSFELVTPAPFNQGGEGSCTGQAIAMQRSIEQYYKTNATSYSQDVNIFSPEFLYNHMKMGSTCGSGSAYLSSLSFVMNRGICRWSVLPYSSQNGCDTSWFTPSMYSDAANYKIRSYHSILATDKTAIKTALFNKHPLAFACSPDLNMYNATCSTIWNSRAELMSGHAMILVGYDDTKRAYKIMNSWGTWNCNGFVWVDQDFFATITGYLYIQDL